MDTDDDTTPDHRLFDALEPARSSHAPNFPQENVEKLAAFLLPLVENVSLIRDVNGSDAKCLESLDDFVDLLPVGRRLKL